MKAIVCVDDNWGIGASGELLVHIPEDVHFFKNMTMGNVIVAGRKTVEGFPKGQPLQGRVNIVLTRNREYQLEGAIIVHSREELYQEIAKSFNCTVFLVGGGEIYHLFLQDCDEVYVTKVFGDLGADVFFDNLDLRQDFYLVDKSEVKQYEQWEYCFCHYQKKK